MGFKWEAIPSKIHLDSPAFTRATAATIAQCLSNVCGFVALEAVEISRKPGAQGGRGRNGVLRKPRPQAAGSPDSGLLQGPAGPAHSFPRKGGGLPQECQET